MKTAYCLVTLTSMEVLTHSESELFVVLKRGSGMFGSALLLSWACNGLTEDWKLPARRSPQLWLLFAPDCRKQALLKHRNLAGAIHDRQFIGKAFFLSDRDYAPIIFFLCSVQQLDRLPEGYMPQISRTKDAVQKP